MINYIAGTNTKRFRLLLSMLLGAAIVIGINALTITVVA